MEILAQTPIPKTSLLSSCGECGQPFQGLSELRELPPPKVTPFLGTPIPSDAGCKPQMPWPSQGLSEAQSVAQSSPQRSSAYSLLKPRHCFSNQDILCSKRQSLPLELQGSALPSPSGVCRTLTSFGTPNALAVLGMWPDGEGTWSC